MTDKTPERVSLTVESDTDQRVAALRDLFPDAFADGGLDLRRIGEVLGVEIAAGPERYGLSWSGKATAESELQTGSVGTLRPDLNSSIDYATARNVLIEGDNLEVLRLLQRGYNDKIKVVYIDPPYNTGKDFVYTDKYAQGLDLYLEMSKQVDEDGMLLSSNTETSGRFHSSWLSMMYPRLALARNLLAQDGVIFVSIDDNEVHNLRHLLDQTFGQENFVAELVWEKTRKNDATFFSVGHEYMYVYARNKAALKSSGPKLREERPGAREVVNRVSELTTEHGDDLDAVETALRAWYKSLPKTHPSKGLSRYKHVDAHGPWRDRDISWPGGGGPTYDVVHPETGEPCAVPEDGWRFSEPETMQRQIDAGLVVFREDHTKPPFRKAHLIPLPIEEEQAAAEADDVDVDVEEDDAPVGLQVMPSVIYKQAQVASKHLKALMGGKVFNNPKDHEVLARLINYVTRGDQNAVILDFFAGSGSTAEAVFALNEKDGGRRQFVGVQLKEPTAEKSVARKQGFENIFDLCRERIVRAMAGLEDPGGLRVLRLARSNFKVWDSELAPTSEDELAEQILAFSDGLADDADDESIVIEVALKSGQPLASAIEVVDLAGVSAARIGSQLVCLARDLNDEVIDAVVSLGDSAVVFLESAFAGDDETKANTYLALRDAGIAMRTV